MSLADCLGKVRLDPADKAAIEASVSTFVAQGMTQDAAEHAAVEAHAARVMASAEDIRKQLNVPGPLDISATPRGAVLNQPKVIGKAELGDSFTSRKEYFSRLENEDKALEKAGNGLETLDGTLFKRKNGDPIVLRVADMDGSTKSPVLSEGGPGEPYYVSTPNALATEENLLPGATVAKLTETAADQLTKNFGDEAYRSGMPIKDAIKRLSKSMPLDEAAATILGHMGLESFDATTLVYRGHDDRMRVITEPGLLVDPATKAPLEFFQGGTESDSARFKPLEERSRGAYGPAIPTDVKVLYREMSADRAMEITDGSSARTPFGFGQDTFWSSAKDLALGQGENKGVHVEMYNAGLSGREVTNQKPGLAAVKSVGGGVEYAIPSNLIDEAKDRIRSFHIERSVLETRHGQNLAAVLKNLGWTKQFMPTNVGGGVRFIRPGKRTLNQGGERGSVTIIDDNYIINIFPGSDLSTILHETGHIFLEEMKRIVQTGNASAATNEDYQILRDWLGNNGEAITREQHEKMATGMEAYFMEGRAPTLSLKNAFGSFRRWLTRIYSRVGATDAHTGLEQTAGFDVKLTPEVREVFDRMLSIEPEVQNASLDGQFLPMGEDLEAHLPEEIRSEARIRIDDLLVEARQHMEDRLFEHRAAAIAEQKPGWQQSSEAAVNKLPVYQAIDFLKKSPLDRATVQSEFGDAALKALSVKHGNLVTADAGTVGLDPNTVADRFGFEDGAALVDALRKSATKTGAVRGMVKALADAEWESYGPADAMADTPEFAATMDAMRAYLSEALGRPGGVDKAEIRRQAEQYISTLSTRAATNVEAFMQDMSRLQRQERTAATKGDLVLALQKNAQARLNFEMARIARNLKTEVQAIVKRARDLKGFDPKKVEYQYGLNAMAMAERYGMAPVSNIKDRIPLRQLLAGRNSIDSADFEPAMDVAAAFPDWILDEQNAQDYKDIPIDDLVDLDHMMRFLMARGKSLRSSELFEGKAKLERVTAEILDNVAELKDKKVFEEGSLRGKLAGFADSYLAGLNIWQFRVRAMDGYTVGTQETGPAEKNLFDPLHEKAGERFQRFKELYKGLSPALEHIRKRMREGSKYVDGLTPTAAMKAKGRNGFTFENVITTALNMGNSYNAEAMALGHGFLLDDGSPDVSKLHEITKSLTAKDWQAVEAIADAVGSLKKDLSAVFERRNGFPMAVVEPEAFSVKTADGETLDLKGWYYPVKFDPVLSDRQAQQDDALDRTRSAFSAFPLVGTRSGMTKRRSSTGGKPLLMTLAGLDSHLKDTVQYISYAETVVDVFKIVKQPQFKSAFEQKFGQPAYRSIRQMLADIGMPDQTVVTKADQALSWLKGMSTAYVLGLNVKTALTQPFSAFNYAADEGWTSAAIGLKHVMSQGPTAAREAMFKLSPLMEERWLAADREVGDAIKSTSWMSNPKLKAVQDSMFSLIQVSDHTTMLPLWWGSYYKRINLGQSEQEAASGADKAILVTYPGNPRALDAAAALRSKNGLVRLLTSFATQSFHFGNRQRFLFQAMKAGKVSKASWLGHVAVEGVAAPLVMQAFFDVLWGNFPPKDEEDFKRYLLSLGTYQFVGLPLIRELINTSIYPDRGFGGNIPAARFLDAIGQTGATLGRMANDLENDKDPKYEKALLALSDLMSYIWKVPASRIYKQTKKGLEQLDKYPNDDAKLEWLNNVFTVLSPNPDPKDRTK